MNKDLDARLIPNGEYRDGKNISVSSSEGSDVGALENIRGNFNLTDFGLDDFNLEVIGSVVDSSKNRIYFFITNFIDGSRSQLDNLSSTDATASSSIGQFTREGAKNCIAYCEIPVDENVILNSSNITKEILVEGAFLNFSKSHPMRGMNILEDLLFFTDNRNQPRKINVEKAIANPLTYYTSEDHISVAKYAPYKAISFLDKTVTPNVSTLKNEVDEWLPASFISPGLTSYVGTSPNKDGYLMFNNSDFTSVDPQPYASPIEHFGTLSSVIGGVRISRISDDNVSYAYIDSYVVDPLDATKDRVQLKDDNGNVQPPSFFKWGDAEEDDFAGNFAFEIKNPDYNGNFSGDKDFLKDKFVKFSYRFKYDDGEYSLVAPFSQDAFVPKQYGYFVGDDDEKTKESGVVEFMENQITTAGLVVDFPYGISDIEDKLKIKQLQLLYKASNETSLKVIADVDVKDLTSTPNAVVLEDGGTGYTFSGAIRMTQGGSGTGLTVTVDSVGGALGPVTGFTVVDYGQGYSPGDVVNIQVQGTPNPVLFGSATIRITSLEPTYTYTYNSQKPIKVLDDQEIIRVNDIVPIRAAAQEIVGNRVVYGNFLQNNETPESLNYEILTTKKGDIDSSLDKEFLNHTVKQGRTYQVGLVLQDRYGRSSNVILNTDQRKNVLNSTIFTRWSNGGSDTLRWPGNSLRAVFNEEIPRQKTDTYSGAWVENENPLGWYSFKIVVKQQDQDYYNVYVPGGMSGNVNFTKLDSDLTYSGTGDKFHISLFNNNINKIPRDLNEVGANDNTYGSDVVLYNRVNNSTYSTVNINEQNHNISDIEVASIKPFSEFGEWTTMKNVNINYVDAEVVVTKTANSGAPAEVALVGPYANSVDPDGLLARYIYPGVAGDVDPIYLENNKNPFVATLTTKSRLGYEASTQESTSWKFAKGLTIFETKPVKSQIDIYYESSSTGLVSDFNDGVAYSTGPSGQPFDTSPFIGKLEESINYPQDVSNVFYAVDSNGVQITQNTPIVRIKEVRRLNVSGAYNAFTVSPFDLQIVQQPGIGVPATYKLVTNSTNAQYNVFTDQSHINGDYKVTFTLSANGMQDVDVTKSFQLSNIKPELYKCMWQDGVTTGSPSGVTDENWSYFVKNHSNYDSLILSSKSSPLQHKLTQINTLLPWDPWLPYNAVSTAVVFERDKVGSGNERVARISHTSNGAEELSIFDISTDNWQSLPQYPFQDLPRNKQLTYEVTKVLKWKGQYKDINQDKLVDGDRGEYYVSQLNNAVEAPLDFLISSNSGNQYLTFNYAGPNNSGTIQNSDMGEDAGDGFKRALVYYVEFRAVDANGLQRGLPSDTYNIHFIIRK